MMVALEAYNERDIHRPLKGNISYDLIGSISLSKHEAVIIDYKSSQPRAPLIREQLNGYRSALHQMGFRV